MEMHLIANAKLNLGLHITGKRADGYHLMETLYYPFPELYDEIVLEPRLGAGCTVEMEGIEEEVPLERNLCWRAWKALESMAEGRSMSVHIRVRKRIPAGAGLGGGSSDAAAVLKGLNGMWGLGLSEDALAEIAGRLGADVPFFIYNRPLFATGIGTVFEPFEMDLTAHGFRIELVTLPLHSSTVLAFQNLDLKAIPKGPSLKELLKLPVGQWQGLVRNDLEAAVFARLPEVAEAKARLLQRGAVYAAMSGSGSACFGLFEIK